MSLINDALKKAARQRAEEVGEYPPMPGGGRRPSRQGGPMQKQTLVLIIAAAVALVVVSAVVTGMLMAGKPEPKAASVPKPPEASAAPKAVVQAPVVAVSLPQAPAAAVAAPKPSPTPVPTPVPTAAAVVAAAPAPASQPPAAPAPIAPAGTQGHNDMVQAIVDGFHISGVRTAGAGSKALIDGHIYKLNDVVDKAVGLRLVKVDEDHLTFVDRDANTFVKSF
jgi:hypothetical protein